MNLENLNVQEINTKELKNVDGGLALCLALAGLCLIAGFLSRRGERRRAE